MKKAMAVMLAAAISVLLASCASIFGKTEYPVNIGSQPAGAYVKVANSAGTMIYQGKTPTTVTLHAKKGYFKGEDYRVTFTMPGYATYEATVGRRASNWYIFGNIAIGGLIGWLIVDPATGAMWKLEDSMQVNLTPTTADSNNADGLKIVALNEVPSQLRHRLVPLGTASAQ